MMKTLHNSPIFKIKNPADCENHVLCKEVYPVCALPFIFCIRSTGYLKLDITLIGVDNQSKKIFQKV